MSNFSGQYTQRITEIVLFIAVKHLVNFKELNLENISSLTKEEKENLVDPYI